MTPERLMHLLAAGKNTAQRAFVAITPMQKIDIEALRRAIAGAVT